MTQKDFSLFESAIQITEERDKRSLEQALVKTITNFVDCDHITLLRIPPNCRGEYLEIATSHPLDQSFKLYEVIEHEYGDLRIKKDATLAKCFNTTDIISLKNRQLFPILMNNKLSGILDISEPPLNKESEKLINGFISIYQNFQTIMKDNEHDTLTGLYNRKTLNGHIAQLFTQTPQIHITPSKNERRLTNKPDSHHWLGILDIDFFKKINDNYGHVYGDEVLLTFANIMRQSFRSNDLLFRFGGEEFVIILTSISDNNAVRIFDEFRKKLADHTLPKIGQVTVSIGVVKISENENPNKILEHADVALYYSKENGRNQVRDYHELLKQGKIEFKDFDDDIELF